MIKSSIDYQIPAQRISGRPKISHCMTCQKRLSEMPYLTGYCDSLNWVGDRKSLSRLESSGCVLFQLVGERIRVIVKADNIAAKQQQDGTPRRAKINFGHAGFVNFVKKAERKSWMRGRCLRSEQHRLKSQGNVTEFGLLDITVCMDKGLKIKQQLQSGMDRELDDLAPIDPRREIRRVCCSESPSFKLQVADRSERRGS